MAKFSDLCLVDNAGPHRLNYAISEPANLRPAARFLQDRPNYGRPAAIPRNR